MWPLGYHCDTKKPLMMYTLSSQKHNMTVYLMSVFGGQGAVGNETELAWFEKTWKATEKKLYMGGCCIHFKTLHEGRATSPLSNRMPFP